VDTLILGGTLVGSVGLALAAAGTTFMAIFKLMESNGLEPRRVEVRSSVR
jgi:hypothetical protein